MTPVVVRHRLGSYAVTVRAGALAELRDTLAALHPGARVVVIADETVASLRTPPLPDAVCLTFPAGERSKNRKHWAMLTDQMVAAGFDRHTVVIGFGGGVTTDLAGFVAATFLRGVPWIALPTSTLAMLDASVGGKTGVDTAAGKNLVGAFHPPSAVLCDPETLDTLPARNFHEGLAEAVKHAAIADAAYGEWMLEHSARIAARDVMTLTELVGRSVTLKATVVSEDEQESGRRATLNAGHTVAHALEMASDFAIPHGEAVGIGLVIETRLAERMGVCQPGTADRIAQLLTALQLPVVPPRNLDRARCIAAMHVDKKNRAGVVHASLLARFGEAARRDDRWTLPLDLAALQTLL